MLKDRMQSRTESWLACQNRNWSTVTRETMDAMAGSWRMHMKLSWKLEVLNLKKNTAMMEMMRLASLTGPELSPK